MSFSRGGCSKLTPEQCLADAIRSSKSPRMSAGSIGTLFLRDPLLHDPLYLNKRNMLHIVYGGACRMLSVDRFSTVAHPEEGTSETFSKFILKHPMTTLSDISSVKF